MTGSRRADGIAAWRRIADQVEADLVAGLLRPGEKLPTEHELAARFAVHRHTVRRALASLAAGGLVRSARGSGTFVEQNPIPYAIGVRTRFTENVGAAGREAGGVLLSDAIVAADAQAAAALDLPAGALVARLETLRVTDSVPIATGVAFFPLPRFTGIAGAYREHASMTRALACCGVVDYRRTESRIGARPATNEEARALQLSTGRVLLAVDSVNVDSAGTPIQFTRALFAADRAQLVVASETQRLEGEAPMRASRSLDDT